MLVLVVGSVLAARAPLEELVREKVESRSRLIAHSVALDLSLESELDSGGGHLEVDKGDMRGLLRGVGLDPQILEVVLFTAAKAPFMTFRRVDDAWQETPEEPGRRTLPAPEEPGRRTLPATLATVVDRGEGFVRCVTPVASEGGPVVGWVELSASTESIDRLEATQLQVMLVISALALGATAALTIVLGNRVTGSVRALSLAATRIGAGEQGVRVEEGTGHDELAALARTFNATMDKLDTTSRALREANMELAGKNAELAQANVSLEALNRELEAFSYSVSHDLRAPLRGMDGFSQALLEDYDAVLDATGKDYLRRIRAGAQRMGTLIDDLLGLSRLSQGELRKVPVDLSAIAAKVVERLRAAEPERAVTVEIAPALTTHGDPALLTAALENLLGNAWKYSGKRADARIELGAAVVDGRVTYTVRDNGAGFDMTHVKKLFGAFQRLHSMTEFAGNGVGLATVQRIIRRHGGRVWAEGEVGKGAAFHFTLGEDRAESRRAT